MKRTFTVATLVIGLQLGKSLCLLSQEPPLPLPGPPPPGMVHIPAWNFILGSPSTEKPRGQDEGPLTRVTLPHDFWIGRFEVTQLEYLTVTGENPSRFSQDLNQPVEQVSWREAMSYCVRL